MADWQIHIDGDIHPTTLDAGDLATILGAWSKLVSAAARQQQIPSDLVGFSVSSIEPGSLGMPLVFRDFEVPSLLIDEVSRWIKTRLTDIPHGLRGPISTLRGFSARTGLSTWFGSSTGVRVTVEPADMTTDAKISGPTTIYGHVVRVGGDEPAIRIDTAYGSVTCRNISQELAQEAALQLYRDVRVSGYATWDAQKYTLTDFRIDSLTPVHLEEPLAVFAELREQIGDAFKGDSVDILRELRE
jgi:hypothetical protein